MKTHVSGKTINGRHPISFTGSQLAGAGAVQTGASGLHIPKPRPSKPDLASRNDMQSARTTAEEQKKKRLAVLYPSARRSS